jgi:hypothetical protein
MRNTSLTAPSSFLALAIAVVANIESLAAAPAALLTTDSRFDNAEIIAVDTDANLTIKVSNRAHELVVPMRRLVRWGSFDTAKGGHRARLARGGELVGHSIKIDNREVTLVSDLWDVVTLPRSAVTAVIFDMPGDGASTRALEERIQNAPADNDTLLLSNGDRLTGRLGSFADDKLTLKTEEMAFVVERSRAAAVVFGHRATGEPKRGIQTWIGLRDGSRFLADRFTVRDGQATIELATASTVSLKIDAITALQPIGGDTVYLSDLNDASYRHIPFLSLAWDYARDRNVTGGPLLADGRLHLKGLGMHSAARITYDLAGEYRAFQAEAGIDDSTGGRGSVTCRVFVDEGAGKWQLKYDSPVIRGGDKPIPVEVELGGVKRLSLLVDFADRGDVLDHINWLDARLVK